MQPWHGPMDAVSSLFLPAGYPNSVSADYLAYQLWALPTHVVGSLCHALTTSSLLSAVGITAGVAGSVATSAAIQWITKDGLGAAGRFLVGGRLADEFDDDPRRWRLAAEVMTSTGAALEIATVAFPAAFLPLAVGGRFAKALGKSLGKPVFRIILAHQAVNNNVGAVSAKEEVWEVAAQLMGYAASLVALTWLDALTSEPGTSGPEGARVLITMWAFCQATHIVLRYVSLKSLVFPTLSEKRVRLLVADHVAGRPLRGPADVNREEPAWLPANMCMRPPVHVGREGVAEVLVGGPSGLPLPLPGIASSSGRGDHQHLQQAAEAALRLYAREEYVLAWRGGAAHVLLKDGAPAQAILRAHWQAAWLQHHTDHAATTHSASDGDGAAASTSASGVSTELASTEKHYGGIWGDVQHTQLIVQSLQALESGFPDFLAQAQQAGWDTDTVLIKAGAVKLRAE